MIRKGREIDRSAVPATFSIRAEAIDRTQPLQQQLFAELKAELLDGLWEGRTDFYTEKEISDRFDVSVITSRAVLDKLADEGWISRGRGRRSLPVKGAPEPQHSGSVPMVTPDANPFDYQLRSAGVGIAPAEACRTFGLPPGARLWQCVRLRSWDGEVHSVTHNAQLPATGEGHDIDGLNSLSMIELLEKRGETVAILRRSVSAISPPFFVASLLGMKLGAPTLLYTCTLHRRDGSIIEWLRVYMRPDHNPVPEAFDIEHATWLSLNRP